MLNSHVRISHTIHQALASWKKNNIVDPKVWSTKKHPVIHVPGSRSTFWFEKKKFGSLNLSYFCPLYTLSCPKCRLPYIASSVLCSFITEKSWKKENKNVWYISTLYCISTFFPTNVKLYKTIAQALNPTMEVNLMTTVNLWYYLIE